MRREVDAVSDAELIHKRHNIRETLADSHYGYGSVFEARQALSPGQLNNREHAFFEEKKGR